MRVFIAINIGDEVKDLLDGAVRELDVILAKKMERTFRITPLPNPTPLQSAILEGWLKGK
jgi:hypothetical protein